MIILPCFEFLFAGSYLTYVLLLAFGFGMVFKLLGGKSIGI